MSAIDIPEDHGKIANVISFLLLCITVLAVGVRVATKWSIARKLQGDDLFAILALVFCSAQTVALSESVSNGLEQHLHSILSSWQITNFQRSIYAANLLYIATLALSKISLLLLVKQLTPIKLYKNLTLYVGAAISVWAISAFLAVAFQCHVPQTWQIIRNDCISFSSFWNYFGASNIIGDLALIAVATIVIWDVHIENKRKAAICCCFGSRIVVVAATILQIVYSQNGYVSEDPTFDLWQQALCTQFIQNLSVITTCVPYLKPFYLGLGSGMMWTDDLRRQGLVGNYGYAGESGPEGQSNISRIRPSIRHNPQKSGSSIYAGVHSQTETNHVTTVEGGNHIVLGKWDEDGQNSQSRIIQTTTWAVGSESAESSDKISEDGKSA